MGTYGAIMTPSGAGAISTIDVAGAGSREVVERIFYRCGRTDERKYTAGAVLYGQIIAQEAAQGQDEAQGQGEAIDNVVLGCLEDEHFSICCHGNPLIVEMITDRLKRLGVEIVSAEEFAGLFLMNGEKGTVSTIAKEGKIASVKAATLKGVRLIQESADRLEEMLDRWGKCSDIKEVVSEVGQVLERSQKARYLFEPAQVVLAGRANSGKSTLFNAIVKDEKAIVTDTAGTTRDWLCATVNTGEVVIKLYDTAGLDDELFEAGGADRESQLVTGEIVERADVVLAVMDDRAVKLKAEGKKVIAVLNKSDLGERIRAEDVAEDYERLVRVSAKQGRGIDELIEAIVRVLGAAEINDDDVVCFTDRQRRLLGKILEAKSIAQIKGIYYDAKR